jgi:putative spermidine/putrescine transport system permease protein
VAEPSAVPLRPSLSFRYTQRDRAPPGVLAGALFSFITSFDELVVAPFISGTGAVALPRRMWDDLLYQIEPTIAVVSTLTIVLSVALMGCAHLQRKRTST